MFEDVIKKKHWGFRGNVPQCLGNKATSQAVLGTLGKNMRVPLPSCAVNYICAHFLEPSQLEEDMVFTGFTYADE